MKKIAASTVVILLEFFYLRLFVLQELLQMEEKKSHYAILEFSLIQKLSVSVVNR